MIDSSVTDFLGRYFELARRLFIDGQYALASFFALTLIEECGKVLYLRGANVRSKEVRREATAHTNKYIIAVINLLTQSDRFDTLPQPLRSEADSWFDTERVMKLRNSALYLHFDMEGQLTTPNQMFERAQAAMHVYLAGFTAVELGEYVKIDNNWINSILESAESFRKTYIDT